MNRRSILGAAIFGFLALIGVRKSEAAATVSLKLLRDEIESRWPPVLIVDFHGSEGFAATITTQRRTYRIRAKQTYLGCVMSNREPRPGEDWLRMSDLADGKCTVETLNKIFRDIDRCERGLPKVA
jgi:hypothetical protein